jgi:hypothetical protein
LPWGGPGGAWQAGSLRLLIRPRDDGACDGVVYRAQDTPLVLSRLYLPGADDVERLVAVQGALRATRLEPAMATMGEMSTDWSRWPDHPERERLQSESTEPIVGNG